MRRPLYDTILLRVPYETAAARLRQDPTAWLPPPATRAPDGVLVTMRAAGLLATAGVDALVHVEEPSMVQDGLMVLPIAWRAASADRVFPRLTADLELESVNRDTSRITLVGSYNPPISVVGGAADRVLGHHIADAVVRMFLEAVAGELMAPCGPPTMRV